MIDDRRKLVNFLFNEVMDVIEKHHVKTWVDQGSLLGTYRDGKFIDYDSDIDFGIFMKDTLPLFSALLDLQKLGYVTRIHVSDVVIIKEDFPMTFVVYQPMPDDHYFHIDYHCTTLSQLNIPYWRCRWRYTLEQIHDSVTYDKYQTRLCPLEHKAHQRTQDSPLMKKTIQFICTNLWRALGGQYWGYHVPKKFYDKLETLTILNHEVTIPSHTEEYLAFRYGSDWRTPKKDWNI